MSRRRSPEGQDAIVIALQLIVQWDAARKNRVLPQSLRNRAIHALGVWTATPPAAPLDVYAVQYSNYEPAEVVALYQHREDAEADAARREGPYYVSEWTVRARLSDSKEPPAGKEGE